MKRVFSFLLFFLMSLSAQDFDYYFSDSTARIDIFQYGDSKFEKIVIDNIYAYKVWGGPTNNLIDNFNNGKYYVKLYDVPTNKLIYSRGFNTVFSEYQTTDDAIKGKVGIFSYTINVPLPKDDFVFVIEKRNKLNVCNVIFSIKINVKTDIRREKRPKNKIVKVLNNGSPHKMVDIVFLAEGYTKDEFKKFEKDVEKFSEDLFSIMPYKKYKKNFNITGVFAPSVDNGTDYPLKGSYKNTVLNSTFNFFNLPRYLLTKDNISLQNLAHTVPYDVIVILVNDKRYGGGGIYNSYAIFTSDNNQSDRVFLHEFGHCFGGLADEYFSSSVAYNDFYPEGIEPTEPNITALLDPDKLKWKDLIDKDIKIPTDWNKKAYDSLNIELNELYKDYEKNKDKIKVLRKKVADFLLKHKLKDKVGAYQGAGYSNKLYRPMITCLMLNLDEKRFCKVCERALERMINYYADKEYIQ